MSELKEHQFCESDEFFREYHGPLSNETHLYYLKSEADKVIAELEMKLAIAQQVLRLNKPEALYSNLETMSRLTHEKYVIERRERHNKYKRCLDKAEMCKARYDAEDAKVNDGLSWEFISPEMKYWERWRNRWDALAEKFKEVK